MKVTMEVDCTPDEARRFMGLPDVERVNNAYIDQVTRAMQGVTSVEQLETYVRQFAPMGQFGLKMFQTFLDNTRQTLDPGDGSHGGGSGG
ncbi:MAG: hypothetical protein H5U21_06800 [Porphyrobacter sp.]|nr:hypothetical protein [Porphyrobacter sp.]